MTAVDPSVARSASSGALVLSALVTDGRDTWLHTEQFFDYSKAEAVALFRRCVAERGWRASEEGK